MKKISLHQISTIIATIITITVNALASLLPLNGQDTGQISDRFDILFVPAGYVFSIWAVIYSGLIIYTIYQALPSQRENKVLNQIAPYYWFSSLANIVWIFLWHYEIFSLTWIVMLVLLGSLILLYLAFSRARDRLNTKEKAFIKLPFSIYLGWISVATVANITQVLFYFDWNSWGLSPQIWTAIMLSVATLLGALMLFRERDIAYTIVLIWAFIGIAVKQADVTLVFTYAWVTVGFLAVLVLLTPFIGKRIDK